MFPTVLLVMAATADRIPVLTDERREQVIAVPVTGTDAAGVPDLLDVSWTQTAYGVPIDRAQFLQVLRRLDQLDEVPGEPIVVGPPDGLAGGGLSITFMIPPSSLTPINGTMVQVTEALEAVSAYFSATISTPATIVIDCTFAALPAGTIATATTRSGFRPMNEVIGNLRTGSDSDDAGRLPATNPAVMPVRYNGMDTRITNENRVLVTAAGMRVAAGPLGVPSFGRDGRLTLNFNLQWDFDPSDGVVGVGGYYRYSFQDYVIHHVTQMLGWTSGVDFLTRDMTIMDLYRFQRDFTDTGTIGGNIQDPDALDYNPGRGQAAAGAQLNMLLSQFGGVTAVPAVPVWTPISMDAADTNTNGKLDAGEGDSTQQCFPRVLSRVPSDRMQLNFTRNTAGANADNDFLMFDGTPIRAIFPDQSDLTPLVSRFLMRPSIPAGVTYYSRSGTAGAPLGALPDFLTKQELLVLDSLGWAVDVTGGDATHD